jgi:ribonucleoside-diphosphate reductase alpha chain
VEEIAGAYMLAYELGCKGITVYRDGSKDGQVLSTGGTATAGDVETGDVLAPRQRPQSIRGVTERVRTGHGNMYVTINFDEADTPFELFGNLGKAGGCDSAQLEAISRLVSLALRSGIEPSTVIEQLRGITCCPAWDEGTLVRSGPDAVALALERHTGGGHGREEATTTSEVQLKFTPQVVSNGNGNGNGHGKEILSARKCPECNTSLIFEEGCMKCTACSWNKCD